MVGVIVIVLIIVGVYLLMVTHRGKTITNSCYSARRGKTQTVFTKESLEKGVETDSVKLGTLDSPDGQEQSRKIITFT